MFTANKQPLEQLFGVDLIYLNETRRSIVMVQYKMMEPLERTRRQIATALGTITQADEAEWVVPIDDQMRDEMARMAQFDRPAGPVGSYRMSPSPFFFKLVRRYGSTGGAGILLSLGHLRQLLTEGQLTGPRGGLRIAYSELQRPLPPRRDLRGSGPLGIYRFAKRDHGPSGDADQNYPCRRPRRRSSHSAGSAGPPIFRFRSDGCRLTAVEHWTSENHSWL